MYDLLIKGGRVIDPAQDLDETLDIAIVGDRIAALAKEIPPRDSRSVIAAQGKIVTPGLIDIHCHVYDGIHDDSVHPDEAGITRGVTTVVDAGSAGQAIFRGFPRYVIPSSQTQVLCFLSIVSQGQTLRPELRDWAEIDLPATVAAVEAHRDVIKGLKLRLVGDLVAREGVEVWKAIKQAANEVGLPVMVHTPDHFGKTPLPLVREIIARLEPGDILTHVYSPVHGGCLSPEGDFYPELRAAQERGVFLDASSGSHFSWDIARKGIAEGILPTTLGTDLTRKKWGNSVYSLTGLMSLFLALGLDLPAIVRMVTANPARELGLGHRLGSLQPGREADISLLEFHSGRWEIGEFGKDPRTITEFLTPWGTVKSGRFGEAQPMAMPGSSNPSG